MSSDSDMKLISKQHHPQLFWPRVLVRKLLNLSTKDSDFSADTEDEEDLDVDTDSDNEEFDQSWFRNSKDQEGGAQLDASDAIPRLRRRNSETFRAQYINKKDLRVRVATWNVGGKVPPDDLDIDDWIDINDPADIYVLGLQEIVPLNAGNIFGAEDRRPVTKWENIIRDTLDRIRPKTEKVKSFSDPPSPSKYKPSEDIPDIDEEIVFESDSDIGEEVHPFDEDSNDFIEVKNNSDNDEYLEHDLQRQTSSPKLLNRLNCFQKGETEENMEAPASSCNRKLTKMLSGTEKIGLCWPEPQLNLPNPRVMDRATSFKSVKSFRTCQSFKTYSNFKSAMNDAPSVIALLGELDLETLMNRKRKPPYVRIVSKQMVGIFLTIWVRRGLRRHIQNVKVSTVGVGVMGYIGNKGSVSVSMSVYQSLFCFICTHLTSGEKDGDELKRNSDVNEIHRRTHFNSDIGLPKCIYDHEKIIWLGDLNYRINLPYDKTRELIATKDWSNLIERDQLVRELRKGCAFDGWTEGALNFPPTYKYELNSEKYYGDNPKVGRRTPAWCDRILSYGKGMKLLNYKRIELKLSDHRPVIATYMAEVEVFSPRRLQRALTFTNAEIENEEVVADLGFDVGATSLRLGQDFCDWPR